MTTDPLLPLAELPGVADAVARARAACEELRWHEAFRRRWREVRAEATVRSARASAALEGAAVPLAVLRDVARGAGPVPDDAQGRVAFGALRAAAEVERLLPVLGARDRCVLPPFGQLLARLHAAAAAGLAGAGALPGAGAGEGLGAAGRVDDVGRPRGAAPTRDLAGLGPAPSGSEVSARLELLGEVVRTSRAPALVVAGVVHGELLALRPFAVGSGVVARATFRLLAAERGLDPTGAVVADVAWLGSVNGYLGAAAGFATGSTDGVAAWLVACADAVRVGADEGRSIADAVLAGPTGATGR